MNPHPLHIWQRLRRPSHSCTSLQALSGSSAASLRPRTSACLALRDDRDQHAHVVRLMRIAHRPLRQMAWARLSWPCRETAVLADLACLRMGHSGGPDHRIRVNKRDWWIETGCLEENGLWRCLWCFKGEVELLTIVVQGSLPWGSG
jgi:hypothetical protein